MNNAEVKGIRVSKERPRILETVILPEESIGLEQIEIAVSLTAIDFDCLSFIHGSSSEVRSYFWGKVTKCGKNAQGIRKGDRVVGANIAANKIIVNACEVQPAPPQIAPERGVFLPLIIEALRITSHCKPASDQAALILGLGPLGLLVASLLLEQGIPVVLGADHVESHRQRFKSSGFDATIDYSISGWTESLDKQHSLGFVIDTTGDPKLFTKILPLVATRGWAILAGPSQGRRLDLDVYPHIHRNGLRVLGLRRIFLEAKASLKDVALEGLNKTAVEVLKTHENLWNIMRTPSIDVDEVDEFQGDISSLVVKWV